MSLPSEMNVIEMSGAGDASVLRSARRPMPSPASHEVLIKVRAAGVNGPDIVQRRGHYPPPEGASDLLGLEVSGVIASRGDTSFAEGDEVCALTNGGGYAEYVAVHSEHCLPIPKGVSLEDAGGLPEAFFTIWSNVFFAQSVASSSILLVHGGAGGLGAAAIQLGSAMGLRVFTTAKGKEACAWCEELGAERAIDYSSEDFVTILREAGGANIIIDIIGGEYIARNIKAAHADGRIINLAFNQGSKVDIDLMPMMLKRLTLTGSTLRSRSDSFKAQIAQDLKKQVWDLFASGKIKATTFKTFALKDASAAHLLMESGSKRGKILLLP